MSIVIYTPFRSQECPPRLLGGRTGDYKENVHFLCLEGPEILQGASLMFIQVILDVQSHLDSIQESRLLIGHYGNSLKNVLFQCT